MRRVVFLVDMNAFFISCEATRNPRLMGVPAAVAGDPKRRAGIVLAANYEARAYGVKTAMVLREALRLCPEMILVPPDHAFYQVKSHEVMDLLSRYSPVIEQNSIDEAWLDMTGTEALFGSARDAAQRISDEIKQSLGLWCSIGIAQNKFLAKMASEMKKPLGITELWEKDIKHVLWPLPVGAMYGVGPKTAQKLRTMGIHTIGDAAKANADILANTLGKAGRQIQLHASGVDLDPVCAHTQEDRKSIGRETTLSRDVSDLDSAKVVLLALADSVAGTARRHGLKGRTVHITIKYSDFKSVTRQASLPATNGTKNIYSAGCALLENNWNVRRPVRLIGITISNFEDSGGQQMSLFDTPDTDGAAKNEHHRKERIDKAVDAIRGKHGRESIKPAALVKKEPPCPGL